METGATGELVRHRQTKGAATDMFGLKPPAPHSDSTALQFSACERGQYGAVGNPLCNEFRPLSHTTAGIFIAI